MKRDTIVILALLIFIIGLVTFRKPIKRAMTRGYINNNPGNIRLNGEKWKGEVLPSKDTDFKTFSSIAFGYRAIFVLLRTYLNNGLNTIEKIITTYAPSSENDTRAYINSVVHTTGIPKDKVLNFINPEEMIKVVEAISLVENGIRADATEVKQGYNLFLQA